MSDVQAKTELDLLINRSDWLYLRSHDGELALCWGLHGQTYEWHMRLCHEDDLRVCLQQIGIAAADPRSYVTWFSAALVTGWLRTAFYGGIE